MAAAVIDRRARVHAGRARRGRRQGQPRCVGETLRVRSQPNATSTIVANLAHGASISIQCKTTGTAVNGITQWDKLSNGYVSRAFVTVAAGAIPTCGAPPPPPPPPDTPTATVQVAAGTR